MDNAILIIADDVKETPTAAAAFIRCIGETASIVDNLSRVGVPVSRMFDMELLNRSIEIASVELDMEAPLYTDDDAMSELRTVIGLGRDQHIPDHLLTLIKGEVI